MTQCKHQWQKDRRGNDATPQKVSYKLLEIIRNFRAVQIFLGKRSGQFRSNLINKTAVDLKID